MSHIVPKLRQDLLVRGIREVPWETLSSLGVIGVALDIDNNIALQHQLPTQETVSYLREVFEAHGFRAILATNNGKPRPELCEALDCGIMQPWKSLYPRKPWKKYFQQVPQVLELEPHEVVMIGDKLFYDVLGALNSGMWGVLTNPMGQDLILDRWFRLRDRERRRLAAMGLTRPQ